MPDKIKAKPAVLRPENRSPKNSLLKIATNTYPAESRTGARDRGMCFRHTSETIVAAKNRKYEKMTSGFKYALSPSVPLRTALFFSRTCEQLEINTPERNTRENSIELSIRPHHQYNSRKHKHHAYNGADRNPLAKKYSAEHQAPQQVGRPICISNRKLEPSECFLPKYGIQGEE